MDKNQLFNETKIYETRTTPSKKQIFQSSMDGYSNYRYIRLNKEFSISEQPFKSCGLIPELGVVWYSNNCKLYLWKCDTNDMEEISTFSSDVIHIDIFVPKPGVFNNKISHCLMVITKNQIMFYGVEKKTLVLINTDFVTAINHQVTCYGISNGDIFIGCDNGSVYQVVYNMMGMWSIKMMNLYDPTSSLFSNLIPSILKRKKPAIRAIGIGKKFMVALSNEVVLYNIDGGFYKVKSIPVKKDYVNIRIVEEYDVSVMFYCSLKDGTRDFYDNEYLFSKKSPLNDGSFDNQDKLVSMVKDYYVVSHKSSYQGTVMSFINFNEFQAVNYDKNKHVENQEVIIVREGLCCFTIYENSIMIVTPRKIFYYDILPIDKYLLDSRPEDVYSIYKNFGERESIVLYYNMLSKNEDASKLEYLCLKSEEIEMRGLFSLLYRLLSPFLFVQFKEIFAENENIELEKVQFRLKNIQKKLKSRNLKPAMEIIDFFLQSCYYVNLLIGYSIDVSGMNFYRLLFNDEKEFKERTIKELMVIFKANQNIESLIKALGTKCPMYLSVEEVYYQRGFDLINKYPSREKLWESLKNFRNIPFNKEIIKKYNDVKFYSGSMTLIRQYFDFDYNEGVDYIKGCIHCMGAINIALEDIREQFLFSTFEALISVLKNDSFGSECICCDKNVKMTLSEVIKLQNKFLECFLYEKTINDSDPRIYELHWKYCAFRDDRVKATKSLLYLIDNKSISLEQRIDLLEKARTVSLHTDYQEEVNMRMELFKIQKELVERGVDDPYIKNMLLSADDLFNDYAYKYPDLALRIIGLSNFTDKKVISELLTEGMKGDFKSAVRFLKMINPSGPVMDYEIIGNILLQKLDKTDSLAKTMLDLGFNFYDVQKFMEHTIKSDIDIRLRKILLDDIRSFVKDDKYCRRIESYCKATHGI